LSSLAYQDPRGRWHEVLIDQTEHGDWQVIDVDGEETEVIETLDGCAEGFPQAEAIARDYVATVVHALSRGGEAARAIHDRGGAYVNSERGRHERVCDRSANDAALPRQAA
jgi:hypothetical protein